MRRIKYWWKWVSVHPLYSAIIAAFFVPVLTTISMTVYYLCFLSNKRTLPWNVDLLMQLISMFWKYALFSIQIPISICVLFVLYMGYIGLKFWRNKASSSSREQKEFLKIYKNTYWKLLLNKKGEVSDIDGPYCPEHRIRLLGIKLKKSDQTQYWNWINNPWTGKFLYKCSECDFELNSTEARNHFGSLLNILDSRPQEILKETESF